MSDDCPGRPFFRGTTLNGHLHDLVTLAQGTDWAEWCANGDPFRRYRERFRLRTQEMMAVNRIQENVG